MIRRPPGSTRTDTLFPYTTLFRSALGGVVDAFADRFDVDADRANQNYLSVVAAARADAVDRLLGAGEVADEVGVDHLAPAGVVDRHPRVRSEEHTSELQSLMRISYAVFCLKKKNQHTFYTSI